MEDEDHVSDAAVVLLTSAAAAVSNWPIGSSCGWGLGCPPPLGPPQ